MSRRKFIVVPLGSAGDVHPLIWLAQLLAARGHDVAFVVQVAMADMARAAGLRVMPTGSVADQEAVIRNPDLWHPDRGFTVLANKFPRWAREMIPAIRAEVVPGQTVLVGAGVAFAARIVAEADHLPLVTVQLQPAAFMSVDDPPVLRAGLEWLPRGPRWVRRGFFALSHAFVDRQLAARINTVRAECGLKTPVRGILRDWWMSPDRVLSLFPEWYAPPQPDWPPQTVVSRFPLYDESATRPLDPALEEFLAAGDPPILFAPGSANMFAREFFAAGVAACARLGRRGLLVSQFAEHLPANLPAGVRWFPYIPFGRVFPRCAAVVHHGGIGTCAQGLAAGVPQLLMPMAHDQPDQAQRLRCLGVADYLYPKAFTAARVADKLRGLLDSPATARACREIKARMDAQLSSERVVEILEATGKP